jgi:threonine/homoserine/homoserine lactone efflux protein
MPDVRWGAAVPLLLASLVIMGSPGPATISLVAAGSAYGLRRSLAYLAGVVAGTMAVLLAVASGITAALLAIPALGRVLAACAGAYILWLAWHVATAPPLGRTEGSPASSLAGGALLGVANPKAWLAIAAVFASAELAPDAAVDAAAKVLLLAGMIVAINATWLAAGASLAPLLHDRRRARLVNGVLATALVGAAVLAVGR